MSPDLAEAFVEHLDRLRRAGHPAGPDDYVVQNTRGGRLSRQRVAQIIRQATERATQTRRDRVIFESAWPTWLITHLTSSPLASSAIEMYVRRSACGVAFGNGGSPPVLASGM